MFNVLKFLTSGRLIAALGGALLIGATLLGLYWLGRTDGASEARIECATRYAKALELETTRIRTEVDKDAALKNRLQLSSDPELDTILSHWLRRD